LYGKVCVDLYYVARVPQFSIGKRYKVNMAVTPQKIAIWRVAICVPLYNSSSAMAQQPGNGDVQFDHQL
jgi:hypothetical protein